MQNEAQQLDRRLTSSTQARLHLEQQVEENAQVAADLELQLQDRLLAMQPEMQQEYSSLQAEVGAPVARLLGVAVILVCRTDDPTRNHCLVVCPKAQDVCFLPGMLC